MDLAVRNHLRALVQEVTSHGEKPLDEGALSEIKKIARASVENVALVFELIQERLRVDHAQVRYQALLLADVLFMRSKAFRDLVVPWFAPFLELTTGIRTETPLPLPKSSAAALRSTAVELIEKWDRAYGVYYKQVTLGLRYLRDKLRHELPSAARRSDANYSNNNNNSNDRLRSPSDRTRASSHSSAHAGGSTSVPARVSAQEREREARAERTRQLFRAKFEEARVAFPRQVAEVEALLRQMAECFDILVPSVEADASPETSPHQLVSLGQRDGRLFADGGAEATTFPEGGYGSDGANTPIHSVGDFDDEEESTPIHGSGPSTPIHNSGGGTPIHAFGAGRETPVLNPHSCGDAPVHDSGGVTAIRDPLGGDASVPEGKGGARETHSLLSEEGGRGGDIAKSRGGAGDGAGLGKDAGSFRDALFSKEARQGGDKEAKSRGEGNGQASTKQRGKDEGPGGDRVAKGQHGNGQDDKVAKSGGQDGGQDSAMQQRGNGQGQVLTQQGGKGHDDRGRRGQVADGGERQLWKGADGGSVLALSGRVGPEVEIDIDMSDDPLATVTRDNAVVFQALRDARAVALKELLPALKSTITVLTRADPEIASDMGARNSMLRSAIDARNALQGALEKCEELLGAAEDASGADTSSLTAGAATGPINGKANKGGFTDGFTATAGGGDEDIGSWEDDVEWEDVGPGEGEGGRIWPTPNEREGGSQGTATRMQPTQRGGNAAWTGERGDAGITAGGLAQKEGHGGMQHGGKQPCAADGASKEGLSKAGVSSTGGVSSKDGRMQGFKDGLAKESATAGSGRSTVSEPVNNHVDGVTVSKPMGSGGSKTVQPSLRESLLKAAPVVASGLALDYWGKDVGMLVNNRGLDILDLSGHWGSWDVTKTLPSERVAELSLHTSYYTAPEPRVQRACGAPLKNGKLCPRRDLEKCPFHGPIIPRDDYGNPLAGPSPPTKLTNKTGPTSHSAGAAPDAGKGTGGSSEGNEASQGSLPSLPGGRLPGSTPVAGPSRDGGGSQGDWPSPLVAPGSSKQLATSNSSKPGNQGGTGGTRPREGKHGGGSGMEASIMPEHERILAQAARQAMENVRGRGKKRGRGKEALEEAQARVRSEDRTHNAALLADVDGGDPGGDGAGTGAQGGTGRAPAKDERARARALKLAKKPEPGPRDRLARKLMGGGGGGGSDVERAEEMRYRSQFGNSWTCL
eukprot:jgi/Mesvir1/22942/Mv19452-RA.1